MRGHNEDFAARAQWMRELKKGGERYPCPTCKTANALSAKEKRLGYQCNTCADREEGLSGY